MMNVPPPVPVRKAHPPIELPARKAVSVHAARSVTKAVGAGMRRRMPVDFRRYPKGRPVEPGDLARMVAEYQARGGLISQCPTAYALGVTDLDCERLLDYVKVSP